MLRSSVALHAQRAGSTFIPRCQKLESSVKSCRRASRGASRLRGRREPSHLAACIRTHTGPVLGTLRFPGLSSSLKLFTRLRQAPRSAKIQGRLSHFQEKSSPPDVRGEHLCTTLQRSAGTARPNGTPIQIHGSTIAKLLALVYISRRGKPETSRIHQLVRKLLPRSGGSHTQLASKNIRQCFSLDVQDRHRSGDQAFGIYI